MRKKLPAVLAVGALIIATPLAAQTGTGHAAPPGGTPDPKIQKSDRGKVSVDPALVKDGLSPDQTVEAYVRMKTEPVAVQQANKGRKLNPKEKSSISGSLKAGQQPVVDAVKAKGGTVQAQMQNAYNGVKVRIKVKDVGALAAVPGVAAVAKAAEYAPDNATSVPFLGAPDVWQNYGYDGKGVKVAVLDSGIDWTHADFGGPGTVEAYQAAKKTSAQPADPKYFGPDAPHVKGGIDLVGDEYTGSSTPAKPDPNPLDCGGHGSHVAGSIGGGGVTEDGKPYTGPYNKSTATKKWKVGPGVAPRAELYSVRVFGCSGVTGVVVEAIDWAVKNDMDVINMSLGSAFGGATDQSAVAATNAAAAGVVVVASAGNSGPNPYLTGSPGTGRGVISVAATDSTPTLPDGALLTSGSTKINAVNANRATLPATPLTVVALKDDPATPENEALGCSAAAFTKNGITQGGNQVAVSQRGDCARVARAIYGQQAGAAAVVMINTDDTLPPVEGKITTNPDDNTPFEVTIPFLGVSKTDGATLTGLNGQQLTMTAGAIENPGFRKAASFTSSGPSTNDSLLKPGVTAPGVGIMSAGNGKGAEAAPMSGTSMAAPHVAGLAALAVQAHPTWNAQEITNLIISSADADGLRDYRVTREGNGLVDLKQAVLGTSFATGDTWKSQQNDTFREPSLSYGFADVGLNGLTRTKKVQLVNKGNVSKTFRLTNSASPQSLPAAVTVSPSSVTLNPGARVTVDVTLSVKQQDVPGSMADPDDRFNFHQVSGRIVATSGDETLAVPYLLVPRSQANVAATTDGKLNQKQGSVTVSLTNEGTKQAATADFYTLGLTDDKGDSTNAMGGADLKAIGVQSVPQGDDQQLVFAISTHTRASNVASLQYNVRIDLDGDGKADKFVIARDNGKGLNLAQPGPSNGNSEVFIGTAKNGVLSSLVTSGQFTTAPTDSGTLLLAVSAKDLGLTTDGVQRFRYTADVGGDAFSGWATYNPWLKPIEDGQNLTVAPNRTVRTKLTVNQAAWNQQKPLGAMIVSFDNTAAKEATLLLGK